MVVDDQRRYQPKERPEVIRVEGGPGSPDLVMETLPADQDDEEYAILEKFISGLRHFEGREIPGAFRRGDRWPDFEIGDGTDRLGIEITWVTYEPHDQLRRREEQYARRVGELLTDRYPRLGGLCFELEDDYQDPPYPQLTSREGEAVAKAIAALIRSEADQLSTLRVRTDAERPPVGHQVREIGPSGVRIGYFVYRFAAAESGAEPIIRFMGVFPFDKELLDSLVWRAIERKLKKTYDRTYSGRLWLLVWGGVLLAGAESSAAAAHARQELAMTSNPFDEIWFVSVAAGLDFGTIERIWP